MGVAAVGLARAMIWLDQTGALSGAVPSELLYAEGAGAATTLLSVIAGLLVGVMTTLFSMTLATLTFASTQFGPRLLQLFLRDRRTHAVLGTYVATLVYSLVVLRAVSNIDEPPLVPRFTISMAMLLVAVCVALILYFGYYVSILIQAPGLIAAVSRDVSAYRGRVYPSRMGFAPPIRSSDGPQADLPEGFESDAVPINFRRRGYVQRLDEEHLMRLVLKRDLVLRLTCRPGDYVMPGSRMALVWPPGRVDTHLTRELEDQFTLGWYRTKLQDVEFPINELIEIAIRALSPGINDPFTATQCIDRLADALGGFAVAEFPSAFRCDATGRLRIDAGDLPTFASLTATCFDGIRQYGQSSVMVSVRLLDALTYVATRAQHLDQCAALCRQIVMIDRCSRAAIAAEGDRVTIHQRALRALAVIEGRLASCPTPV
jgi:uncharacterized membrane protein